MNPDRHGRSDTLGLESDVVAVARVVASAGVNRCSFIDVKNLCFLRPGNGTACSTEEPLLRLEVPGVTVPLLPLLLVDVPTLLLRSR